MRILYDVGWRRWHLRALSWYLLLGFGFATFVAVVSAAVGDTSVILPVVVVLVLAWWLIGRHLVAHATRIDRIDDQNLRIHWLRPWGARTEDIPVDAVTGSRHLRYGFAGTTHIVDLADGRTLYAVASGVTDTGAWAAYFLWDGTSEDVVPSMWQWFMRPRRRT